MLSVLRKLLKPWYGFYILIYYVCEGLFNLNHLVKESFTVLFHHWPTTIARFFQSMGIKNNKVLLLLVVVIAYAPAFTQTKAVDSLKTAVNLSQDSSKAYLYLSLAEEFQVLNYDSAIKYGNKMLEEARLQKNTMLEVKALIELAYINTGIGKYKQSLSLYNQAKNICREEKNPHLLAQIYLNLGRYYTALSNFSAAIRVLDTALSFIDENTLSDLKPIAYNRIGYIYILMRDMTVARYYIELSIDASMDDPDKSNYINNLLLMGRIYLKEEQADSCLFYYNQSLSLAKQMNDKVLIQQSYRKKADYYIEIKEYPTAIMYIDSSLIYCRELQISREEASLITYKAHISSLKGDYENALSYNLQALELRKSTGQIPSVCASYLNIGGNYMELGKLDQAALYLEKGISIAEKNNIFLYLEYGYGKLSSLYRLRKDYEKALQFADLRAQYKDSLVTNRTNEKVMFFRNQYEQEKIKTLTEKIKLKEKINQTIFMVITLILLTGVILLLTWLNFVRKKSMKEIYKLSRIIETTNQGVVISNIDNEIEYVNKGMLNMFGFSNKKALIGKSIMELYGDKEREKLASEVIPALLREGHWQGEMNNLKNNGSSFVTEENCSVISRQDGVPEFYVTLFSDVSKRKKTEAELEIIRKNLEKTVRTQDKMFSIIAHDLTGPFSSILSLSEIMANKYNNYSKDDHIRFSQLIYSSSKNTFELLTNLLDWSRSQLGNIKLGFEDTNIQALVAHNGELLKLMILKKELHFHNEVSEELTAYIDNNTINVVVRNLLTNAIKFTARGGSIRVNASKDKSHIVLSISDTGIGIEPEAFPGLFDLNDHKSHRGTEDEKGTGFGLILCKEFTELNHGTLTVESSFGKGSTFHLRLPASKA